MFLFVLAVLFMAIGLVLHDAAAGDAHLIVAGRRYGALRYWSIASVALAAVLALMAVFGS